MEPSKITIHDAKGRMDRDEELLWVDARSPEAWEKSDVKLPGAIRMNGADELMKTIPANRALITYCSSPHEESSVRAALGLINHGFENVHILYGGLEAWQQAGYPVETR